MSFADDLLRRAGLLAPAKKSATQPEKPLRITSEQYRTTHPRRRVRKDKGKKRPPRYPDMSNPNACKPWDADENAKLTNLILELKLPAPVIAKRMGRSVESIKVQSFRLGLSLATSRSTYYSATGPERAKIVKLYNSGMNTRKIASQMKLTENQVRGWINRLCTCNRHHQWTPQEEWMIMAYHPALSFDVLAEITGIKASSIKSRKNRIVYSGRRDAVLGRKVEQEKDLVAQYLLAKELDPADHRTIV